MLNLDEIRALLLDMNLSRVSEATKVPYGRVYRLAHTDRSRSQVFETVSKVAAYLESRQLTKAA